MQKIVQHFIPGVVHSDPSKRNAKGASRPDDPCAYAPVFIWPPKPLAFLMTAPDPTP